MHNRRSLQVHAAAFKRFLHNQSSSITRSTKNNNSLTSLSYHYLFPNKCSRNFNISPTQQVRLQQLNTPRLTTSFVPNKFSQYITFLSTMSDTSNHQINHNQDDKYGKNQNDLIQKPKNYDDDTSNMNFNEKNGDGDSKNNEVEYNINSNSNNTNQKRKRKSNKSNRWSWTKKWKEKKRNKKNNDNNNYNNDDDSDDDDDDDEHNYHDVDNTNNVVVVGGGGGSEQHDDQDMQEKEQDNQEPTKKKNMRKDTNLTWSDNPKAINEGSFASQTMQELYNVHVDIPLPKSDSSTTTIVTNDNTKSDAATTTSDSNHKNDEQQEESKLPKRKVALFIGFLGTNYQGMQMNRGQRTIQAELELALFKAKLISSSNFGYPNKYSWSSSARTDKGVHSCAQVCSVKILAPTEDMEVVCEMINKELPHDIEILDVKRVARSFVAKTARDKVRYQYMLPSFVLQDYETVKKLLQSVASTRNGRLKDWNDVTAEEIYSLRESLKSYRASKEILDKLNDTLARFAGTHKFHNYTSKKDATDASAKRYIHSFQILDTTIDESGMEWISTRVVGQSFLLHQIRKMISMAIDVTRGVDKIIANESGDSTINIMEESLSSQYMSINVAPAQGLFLEMSYFDQYNKRAQGKGEDLDWHSNPKSPSIMRWKNFKETKVMKHIMKEEEEQNNFIKYLFIQEMHLKHVRYETTDEKKHTTYKADIKE